MFGWLKKIIYGEATASNTPAKKADPVVAPVVSDKKKLTPSKKKESTAPSKAKAKPAKKAAAKAPAKKKK